MSADPHLGRKHGLALHRVEGFSDAVFAFAVTLLVVSLEVPHSAQELFHTMRGFVAFGVCFGFLTMVWLQHHDFFRLYGLSDRTTALLNMLLLFVVLLYVYPMKFLFTAMFGDGSTGIQTHAEIKTLMQVYGLGFLAVNLVLLAMHRWAWRFRDALLPEPADRISARGAQMEFFMNAAVAVLSIAIARFGPGDGALAGWVYCILAPLHTWRGFWIGRQHRILSGA
ncbi:MAG: DUF1211 domain-containing protein [Acidobacteria bacterium]|nr:DUF1211 domain-containing protein [Acidobacteriota bacterium]